MSRTRRMMVKAVLVLGMAAAGLLVPRPGAVLGACGLQNQCIDNCENIPHSYISTCEGVCGYGVVCTFAGGMEPYEQCPVYVYACEFQS